MDQPKLILKTAIKDGNDEITELTFRRPTAGDFMATDDVKGTHACMIKLMSLTCATSVKALKQLDGYDYMEAAKIINGFLPSDLQIGGTS
jgi:hypothetical protein